MYFNRFIFKKHLRPERSFIILGAIFGLIFLLITPPFQVPDEPSHFLRAFHVSEFGIISQKLEDRQTPTERFFEIRKDGKLIEYISQEVGDDVSKSIYEVLPPEIKERAVQLVKNVSETGEPQVLTFQLSFGGNTHHYKVRLSKDHEERIIANVTDVIEKKIIGALLPKSLKTTIEGIGDGIAFHPERKQDVHEILSSLYLDLNTDEREFAEFPNTALYTPIPYLPQALGITIGKTLNLSPLMLFYLGRLFNLFFWIILISIAIRTTPVGKWIFFLLAMTPMSLFLASSLSADAFTNGMGFLTIAIFLKYALDEGRSIKINDILIIFLMTFLLTLSKQVYFLVPFLFFLIPIRKFGTKKRYFIIFASLLFFNVTFLTAWSLSIKDIYVPYPLRSLVSPDEQILFITNNFMDYCGIILHTLKQSGLDYARHFIGWLGWLDTRLPDKLIFSYIFALLIVAFTDNENNVPIDYKRKVLIAYVMLSTVFLIMTALYVTWTAPGENFIEGIQGRYIIPVSPLFFLLFSNRIIRIPIHIFSILIIVYSLFVSGHAALILFRRFYS